jgi:hypothetical protein
MIPSEVVASSSLLFLDLSYNRISVSIPTRSPAAPGRPRPPPSWPLSRHLEDGSLPGLSGLTAAAQKADGSRNRGDRRGEGGGSLWKETPSVHARWPLRCFEMRARSSGSSAAQKIACFLEILLNKLEISVPHYFGTGSTLLRYHGTVRYRQFGSANFTTVRSWLIDSYYKCQSL